jgi:23S rRNA pseudouridine2457 synthase
VLIALYKPYGVLSRFTPDGSAWQPLSGLHLPPSVYPLGRLDADSEGLLLLSDERGVNARLMDPKHRHPKTYWAQVERIPTPAALAALCAGVTLSDGPAKAVRASLLEPAPDVPPRDPPIRYRKSVPDCWMSLVITEGRNRQVRRMTAAVEHPTLRLIREAIGGLSLSALGLAPGQWRDLTAAERALTFSTQPPVLAPRPPKRAGAAGPAHTPAHTPAQTTANTATATTTATTGGDTP